MAVVVRTIPNDTVVLLVLGGAVALLAVAMETLARRRVFPQWLCRKILHLGGVGACAIAPLLLTDLTALSVVVAVAALVLFGLVGSGVLFREDHGRPSWGIALFPLPYLVLLVCFPEPSQRSLIVLPMLILAVSDAMAAVVGTLVRTPSFTLTGDRKTLAGSLTFVVCTWGILVAVPSPLAELALLPRSATALFVAVVLAALEALGSKGRDNLYIPSAAAMLLAGPAIVGASGLLSPAVFALPIALVFVVLTVRRGWLTLGGGVAAGVLGLWVIFFQGIIWLLPLGVFLVTSTMLGRLLRTRATSGDAKAGRARDAAQVFANGGMYGLAAALFPPAEAQVVMAISVTAAAADTWASEIGVALKGHTYDIVGFRPVPVGISGGISVGGTLGAAGGALVLAAAAAPWVSTSRPLLAMIATVAAFGFAGMLIDSVLGSLLQAKYRGRDGLLRDTPDGDALLARGAAWMTNDAVNVVSNVLIVALGLWWLT